MRAINHALTGTIIGLTVSQPVIALPAALASHFICDMIPHHGSQEDNPAAIRSKLFRNTLYADAGLCLILVLTLAIVRPRDWLLAACCAFVAASPDLLFVKRYLLTIRHKTWKPSAVVKWAIDIQWFQRPIGAVVEIAWFAAALIILIPLLKLR
jgi:hypothetical protein